MLRRILPLLGLASFVFSVSLAQAEDYCDTADITKGQFDSKRGIETAEKAIRTKCKAGDIIWVDSALYLAKLCDMHQTVVPAGGMGAGFVCFLAPPRKMY